jgi:hypothetical protein
MKAEELSRTDAGIEIGIKNTSCCNCVPGLDAVQFGIFYTSLLQSNVNCIPNYAVSSQSSMIFKVTTARLSENKPDNVNDINKKY